MAASLVSTTACSHGRGPAPAPSPSPSTSSALAAPEPPKEVEPEAPAAPENPMAYRASIGHGAVLYLPPWFAPKRGGYDLVIHFHGLSRWQEANVERASLNVAVVSVNLGAGTDPYSNAFKAPDAFSRLLVDTEAEVARSGRAPSARIRRIALSAWSAGFSSISRLMTNEVAQRIDAVLLADGFFTAFTEPKRRKVSTQALEKFAKLADAARRDEKLFAITHTTIPTGPYPSVQECVAKLLDMIDMAKTSAPALGPRNMHQIYLVDRGSFHVRGFHGTLASDHVKQLQAMGETLYPYLRARWDRQDAEEVAPPLVPVATRPPAPVVPAPSTPATRSTPPTQTSPSPSVASASTAVPPRSDDGSKRAHDPRAIRRGGAVAR